MTTLYRPRAAPELVGIHEVAERLGVEPATVRQWRHRDLMPPADWELAAGPVWWWGTIHRWAIDTDRM